MALMREETFGPAVGIMRVASDEEAIRLMNDSDFGLTAAIFSADAARAETLGRSTRNRHRLLEPLRLPRPGIGLDRREKFRPRLHPVARGLRTADAAQVLPFQDHCMSTTLRGNWNYPTTIWAGPGRIAELPEACARLGMKRPLIVTDEGLANAAMIHRALAAVQDAALFSAVRGNPAASHVDAGLKVYRSGQHDGVIAFGGGSALDAGKAIAFMSGQTRPLWDFEDIGDWWTRADPGGIAPVVAIPHHRGHRLGSGPRQRHPQ